MGSILRDLQGKVAEDSELSHVVWLVAGAVRVWQVDVGEESFQVVEATNRTADLLPADGSISPVDVFTHLAEVVQEWVPLAAEADVSLLRVELASRGVLLDADVRQRAALDRLAGTVDEIFPASKARLNATLELPRVELVTRVTKEFDLNPVVLVTGYAGVGKSVVAGTVARQVVEEGGIAVAISLAGRSGQTLRDIETELDVSLRAAMLGAPMKGTRMLVIDGAEQALTDAGALLRSLMAATPSDPEREPAWRVLVTARIEAADALRAILDDVRGANATRTVVVDDFSDEEVSHVLDAFPRLRGLTRHPRPRRLLRRPFVVDILLRSSNLVELPSSIVGEEDVLLLVEERIIRRADGALPGRGIPFARRAAYLRLADAVIANTSPARLEGADAEALHGLVSDDIVKPSRTGFQFAHDVLSDYAVTLRMFDGGGEILPAAVLPRRLLRAVRLWFQRRLADALAEGRDTVRETWRAILEGSARLAELDGVRWNELPIEALLQVGRSVDVIDALAEDLLRPDGVPLRRFLEDGLRLGRRYQAADAPESLDVDLTAPVIGLLAQLAEQVPPGARAAAILIVRDHLKAAAALPDATRSSVLPGVERLADALLSWIGDVPYGELLDVAIEALALLGGDLSAGARRFLLDKARERPTDLEAAVEEPASAGRLAKEAPDLLLRIAGAYYLGVDLTLEGADEIPEADPDEFSVLGDDEGVRDHSHRGRVIEKGLADPSLGPFKALLEASAHHGLRLIGTLVDAATRARVQLESRWGDTELSIEVDSPGGGVKAYRGTGHVWLWYRRLGVGPYSAQSALMALREWGVTQVRQEGSVTGVLRLILDAGDSLAFVAVALSVAVECVDLVGDELDGLLVHPLLWRLEQDRTVQEASGLALGVSQPERIRWSLSEVAMWMVLNGSDERRRKLRDISRSLSNGAHELLPGNGDQPDDRARQHSQLLTRKWATELDILSYRMEPREGGIAIHVDYPEDVRSGLQSDPVGRAAAHQLSLHSLTFRASRVRDGESDDDAMSLWRELASLDEKMSADGIAADPIIGVDAKPAVAAAVIVQASRGVQVEDEALRAGARVLLKVAEGTGSVDDLTHGEHAVPSTLWDQGADRSAATALPAFLLDDELRKRGRVADEELRVGLLKLATSQFHEVRRRLELALRASWEGPCSDYRHAVALDALRRLIASSGLGPWEQGRRERTTLEEPLEAKFASGSHLLVDVALTSDGLPGLLLAARFSCDHGLNARGLVNAITVFDRRVWPAEMARVGYEGANRWRSILDGVVVERTLSNDPALVRSYLEAFAPVAEELRSMLVKMAEQATSSERADALFKVWPEFMDALLPEGRHLADQAGPRGRRPHLRDIWELDRALLPLPPEGAVWAPESVLATLGRWVEVFKGFPHVADHLIRVLARLGLLRTHSATGVVLRVLGDDVRRVSSDSGWAVPWLRLVLSQWPDAVGEHRAAAQALLDGLAAYGDESALRVQRELES